MAIKVLRSEKFDSDRNIRQFFEEARTSARLEHPGIVPVHDVGTDESGVHYIVMQYIKGQTLHERIAETPMSPEEAASVVCRIAEAVHFAHKRQFFHRDLKPANILIDEEGHPYVADFGLALTEAAQWKHEGEVAGTLLFMAPEQIRGESHRLDGRTDIWSLGAILYVLLTGRPPFNAPHKRLAEDILLRDPRPLRQIDDTIPRELERICLKCLSKPVRERYSSAIDLADELRAWLEQSSVSSAAGLSSLSGITGVRPAKKPVGLAVTAIVCSLVAVAVMLALTLPRLNRDDDQPPDGDLPLNLTVDDMFQIDQHGIVGRWYPMFDHDPRSAGWPEDVAEVNWDLDKTLEKIAVDNRWSGGLSFGRTDRDSFEIEVDLSRSNPESAVGVFFGFENYESVEEENKDVHLQYVYLFGEAGPDPDNDIRLAMGVPGLDGPRSSMIASAKVDAPLFSSGRLNVVVRNGRLYEVRWNNRVLDEMLRDPDGHQAAAEVSGEFGIFVRRGAAVFRNGRFRLLK